MTDQIYDDIAKISDICIDYCNELLKMFNQPPIYEYPYQDDIKHLFGLETEMEIEKKYLKNFL